MIESSGDELSKWAGWVASVITALGGFYFTTKGWKVRGEQAKGLARQKDVNDSISSLVKSINEFVDAAISFWCENESDVELYSVQIRHNRIVTEFKVLSRLRDVDWPKEGVAELRRLATLDAETADRPIGSGDGRIKKLVRVSAKLIESDFMRKDWS